MLKIGEESVKGKLKWSISNLVLSYRYWLANCNIDAFYVNIILLFNDDSGKMIQ